MRLAHEKCPVMIRHGFIRDKLRGVRKNANLLSLLAANLEDGTRASMQRLNRAVQNNTGLSPSMVCVSNPDASGSRTVAGYVGSLG